MTRFQGTQKFKIRMQNVSLGLELGVNLVTLCDDNHYGERFVYSII